MSTLLVEQDGPLAIVRLDKGRGNAIDDALLADLTDWSGEAARDDAVRGVMLASAHPKLFCPGLDLLTLVDLDRAAMTDFMDRFATAIWSLYSLPKPMVACINGAAVAGGCILALTADSRVMARGAAIGLNELKIGVPLPWSVIHLLKGAVPPQAVAEVALLGRNFSNDDALRVGLADLVVEREALEHAALARLQEFAEKDAQSFSVTKGWIRLPALKAMRAGESEANEVWLDSWFSESTRARLNAIVASLRKG